MWIDGDMSALVEWIAAHRLGGLAANPDRQQNFPLSTALSHGVVVDIGEPQVVIRADRDTVGTRKHVLVTPAVQKFSAIIQDHNRGVATVEHIDSALGVDGDPRDVVGPFVGHLTPFFDYLVEIIAATRS